jgi:hypothetical protein
MGLDAEDFALLSLVDGKRTLYDLCARGPKPGKDNAKFLYAMYALELVRPARTAAAEAHSAPVPIRAFRRSNDSLA